MTTNNSMALLVDGTQIYSGEFDGVYQYDANGQNRKKVCNLESVTKIVKDDQGTIWL